MVEAESIKKGQEKPSIKVRSELQWRIKILEIHRHKTSTENNIKYEAELV